VVIAVGDIRDGMKKVAEAGGTILGGSHAAGEPDDIPGVGLYISFLDSEGNRVSMIQPKGM
jgi:predicted enzyme related to lactoylglutathione lyase